MSAEGNEVATLSQLKQMSSGGGNPIYIHKML